MPISLLANTNWIPNLTTFQDFLDFKRHLKLISVHLTRFASSQHVSEFKKENGESGSDDNAPLCIDGFFNNLNCLAVFLAHIIDSLHRATSEFDEKVRH